MHFLVLIQDVVSAPAAVTSAVHLCPRRGPSPPRSPLTPCQPHASLHKLRHHPPGDQVGQLRGEPRPQPRGEHVRHPPPRRVAGPGGLKVHRLADGPVAVHLGRPAGEAGEQDGGGGGGVRDGQRDEEVKLVAKVGVERPARALPAGALCGTRAEGPVDSGESGSRQRGKGTNGTPRTQLLSQTRGHARHTSAPLHLTSSHDGALPA